MRSFVLIAIFILTAIGICQRSCGQDVTNAPLYLYVTGSGSVTPLQNGQSLVAGQTYDMQAIPAPGFAFDSWSGVNVFIFVETNLNPDGTTNAPITSVIPSPTPPLFFEPTLEFIMQPQEVLFDVPGVRTVTRSEGWQVNFVPVPEPSSLALILCGLAFAAVMNCAGKARERRRSTAEGGHGKPRPYCACQSGFALR